MTQATRQSVPDLVTRPGTRHRARGRRAEAVLSRLRLTPQSPNLSGGNPAAEPAEPHGKRAAELATVLVTSPLWLPLLGLFMLAVRLDSAGPAVYRQPRYGKDGRVFTLLKLRSMRTDAAGALPGHLAACGKCSAEWDRHAKLRADPRLTRLGGWLRRSSLDELPQLLNVLRGQMSLVGPRPIPLEERPRYGQAFDVYQQVRPGLTGLWQVSGRNELTYDTRIALDRQYVRSRSWRVDLLLMWRTVGVLRSQRGAY